MGSFLDVLLQKIARNTQLLNTGRDGIHSRGIHSDCDSRDPGRSNDHH